ncbi:hypothetical protein ACH5RR_036418 [Cinchona calisaya]|uniref:Uncharacterized protein n=1 Tax=Cinchona calisaya TaxID=153742 RepID=A0ABD2Y6P9_9GENT
MMVKQTEMEQHPRKSNMSSNNNKNQLVEDKDDRYLGDVAVHSQVKKIKQEMEKFKYPAALHQQPEMRPVLLKEISLTGISTTRQKRSRSPLGLAENRPISVGSKSGRITDDLKPKRGVTDLPHPELRNLKALHGAP